MAGRRKPQRYVALLAAVNVGGAKVSMKQLTELCEGLGWSEVKTYGNSGNVRFETTTTAARAAKALEDALEEAIGRPITVVVRTPAELADAADRCEANGKAGDGPKALHIGFCSDAPAPDALDEVDWDAVAPDHAVVDGKELLLRYPDGMGRSKLTTAWLRKRLGDGIVCTARSLKVARTLSEL